MMTHDRYLSELQHYVKTIGGGMDIRYSGMQNVMMIDDIPHPWSVSVGRRASDAITSYGVSMQDAVEKCWKAWQES